MAKNIDGKARWGVQRTEDAKQHIEDVVLPDVFGGNHSAEFAYKKTQRIVAACYIITETWDTREPLRGQIRTEGLTLLSTVLSALPENTQHDTRRRQCRRHLAHLLGLLDVARTTGLLSEMNCRIISQECAVLDQIYNRGSAESNGSFGELFFNVAPRQQAPAPNPAPRVKDTSETVKDNIKDTKKTSKIYKGQYTKDSNLEEKGGADLNTRQNTILDVVRKKGRINVKDISRVIVDCSEKTLQRELAALVHAGLLRKEGNRRWSTYVLAAASS